MKIRFSEIALDELEDIKAWIAGDSQYYANRFIDKIFASAEKLRKYPELGRVVPEVSRDDIRELIFQNYRIIYKLKSASIIVLTVIHGSKLLDSTGPWMIE